MTLKEFSRKYDIDYGIVWSAINPGRKANEMTFNYRSEYEESFIKDNVIKDLRRKESNLTTKLSGIYSQLIKVGEVT